MILAVIGRLEPGFEHDGAEILVVEVDGLLRLGVSEVRMLPVSGELLLFGLVGSDGGVMVSLRLCIGGFLCFSGKVSDSFRRLLPLFLSFCDFLVAFCALITQNDTKALASIERDTVAISTDSIFDII